MIACRFVLPVVAALLFACKPDIASLERVSADAGRAPSLYPDYSGTVLPPNIAPINFRIAGSGTRFTVILSSAKGKPIVLTSVGGDVRIPEKKWRPLLMANAGDTLRIVVFVRSGDGSWRRFRPAENAIAREPVDPYLTYRSLSFLYNYSSDLRIHERHLESFREKTLVNTKNFYWGCVNCHTPGSNDPSRIVVHTRSNDFGSAALISSDGAVKKINAKLGYTSWHPGGDYIAFSISKVRQCFHSTGKNPIDDYDLSSNIYVYDVRRERMIDVPLLYREDLIQTWPAWSPDGRFLYYSSGPILWDDFNKVPPDGYDRQKCSLLRIAFDNTTGAFGSIDTVLSSSKTGLSITQPRLSPDGRFVLFCMHAFGPYPITQPSSDLYLMDLATGGCSRLAVSSDESESWHGWSKNGRWIVFSSKRNGGILTRLYFSHVDSLGNAAKPFILPQKDPRFYDSYIRCFNVPELATGSAPLTPRDLLKAIRSPQAIDAPLPSGGTGPSVTDNPSAEWSPLQ
ncbi:MAG: PD40 domain-containing protein [Chitinispirillaceae bacterium]|nr:PD40 domain-containing protein [Chitinispirillaceae bacterium]